MPNTKRKHEPSFVDETREQRRQRWREDQASAMTRSGLDVDLGRIPSEQETRDAKEAKMREDAAFLAWRESEVGGA